jgi:hypothetical protein
MKEIPIDSMTKFADFRVYTAAYQTEQGETTILLEFRTTANEEHLLFTMVGDQEIRAGSIHELVYTLPSLVSLSISHTVHMLWNGEVKQAELTEIFRPRPNVGHSLFAALQLRLVIEGRNYETSLCNTLQDAVWELQEITEAEADWWLRTCYHCQYAGQARDYATSDREYWCYRDVPDAFAEIQAKGKYASREALYAGSYFVNAFHVCAAWRPIQTASAADEES